MYTRKYIDIVTLALVIIIFIIINIYHFQLQGNIEKLINTSNIEETQEISKVDSNETFSNNVIKEQLNKIVVEDVIIEEPAIEEAPIAKPIVATEEEIYPKEWFIMIPVIDLIAPIQQGTTTEILNQSVGHFEESPLLNGNVCLAAHNRGYQVNYFEKLKNLLLKDVIIYQYGDIKRTYAVSNITIIKEEDWSYVEEKTNKNKITLITCVENKPEYRLCVQATEI